MILKFSALRMLLTQSKSLLTSDFTYNITTLHDIACAPMYDGVSEISFQILEEQCSKGTIYQRNNFSNVPFFITSKCSSTTVGLSDGVYGKRFTWILEYQMYIQVSISHELQYCTSQEIYIVIKLRYEKIIDREAELHESMRIYIWRMEQDRFEWTIWDYGASALLRPNSNTYSLGIELFISVKRHSRNNVELYPNISSCYQTIRIEHQNKKVDDPHYGAKIHKYFDARDYVHCLLSTCYYLYPFRANASWNSAQALCQQDGRQLLTMNSDIKAQFIENILYEYIYLYFPRDPLLFLNMKQDDKVGLCAIVSCVGCNIILHKITRYKNFISVSQIDHRIQ